MRLEANEHVKESSPAGQDTRSLVSLEDMKNAQAANKLKDDAVPTVLVFKNLLPNDSTERGQAEGRGANEVATPLNKSQTASQEKEHTVTINNLVSGSDVLARAIIFDGNGDGPDAIDRKIVTENIKPGGDLNDGSITNSSREPGATGKHGTTERSDGCDVNDAAIINYGSEPGADVKHTAIIRNLSGSACNLNDLLK